MLFVSYQCYYLDARGSNISLANAVLPFKEPTCEESILTIQDTIKEDLKERLGIEQTDVVILWWKKLVE